MHQDILLVLVIKRKEKVDSIVRSATIYKIAVNTHDGMGTFKLADTLGITNEAAEELFQAYAEAFPKLNKWLDTQGKLALSRGYAETFAPAKRKRFFPEVRKYLDLKASRNLSHADWKEMNKIEGAIIRNGMNMPIQGSGADICKEALVDIRNLIKEYNTTYNTEVAYLISTQHDAIDTEVREDLAEEFAKKKASIMISCGNKYVQKVSMEVDITITDKWTK